jgi:hypothetical protein
MNMQLMTTHKARVWKFANHQLWIGICQADGCTWKYISSQWIVCYLATRDHMIVRHAIHT